MEEETIITAALSTLASPQLTDLTSSILSLTLHHHSRLSSLLCSPSLFSLALHHLHSLSLAHKTLLVAKYLLSSLHHLTRHFHPPTLIPPHPTTTIKHRDLDAALLLIFLCDVHQESPEILKTPRTGWREGLRKHYSKTVLRRSSVGVHYGGVLLPYVEMVIRCWRFVGVMAGCAVKEGREVAAAPAAVVALPAVEVRGDGGECVICREKMGGGRDVCELPCEHLFHWMCILPWLKKTNTCPCCRFQLPTEDVFCEIERLWSALIKIGDGALSGVTRT
ncbi:E3 ubiquitin-protein ligase SGR9 [Populus alba x Populus x berolinensis]|nr:E3 ubiquitin-protein ligase SGR9 [Populus alba x Populus x berolinensis]